MLADIAISASYKCVTIFKRCLTAEFIEACEGLHASDRYTDCVKAAIPLPLYNVRYNVPGNYKTLWSICVSVSPACCVQYVGNWMAQTLRRLLTNWLLIMHGWPRLSSQALRGALPICCLDDYSWNWVGMCFVTLLMFACMPIPWDLGMDVGKSSIGTVTNDLHDIQDEKYMFNAFAWKSSIWEGNLQINLLILRGC